MIRYILLLILISFVSCDDFLTKDVKFGGASSSTTTTTTGDGSSGAPTDDDNDGLSNEVENTFGLNSQKADTDNDGFDDGVEFVGRLGDPLNTNITPSPFSKKNHSYF